MNKILLIGFGGAIGAVLRYAVSGLTQQYAKGLFPWSTLAVNLSGALLIGFLWGLFESFHTSSPWRVFLFIGILGSYTTFSTFYMDNFQLLRGGEIALALLNIAASNVAGIALLFLGYYCSRIIVH